MIKSFDARKLRALLKRTDKPVFDLADRLEVSRQTIYNWMDGKYDPSTGSLAVLADYFDVDIDYFFS